MFPPTADIASAVRPARGPRRPGDIDAIGPELGVFDAAVGRRVLMYQANPVATLRAVVRALRPGALVVFQEADATMFPASRVPLPLNERANRWMWQTVEREGGNIHMGFDLVPALEEAGLLVEQVRAEAIVQTPKLRHPVGRIIRVMLPRIVEHGVATEAEIDVDTLDERLAAECAAANATYIGDVAFGEHAKEALLSVAGRSERDVYAVGADKGAGPLVLHYDGAGWQRLATGARGDLWWVHAFATRPHCGGGPSARANRGPTRWPCAGGPCDPRES